ncbi:hypothetical protein ABZ590_06575 [Streptomyces hirsutus]|uniref:hypothetical protein n=1 Tax=Streptomyces hirsutus TaxID=35620 RepID=UPI0033C053A2
MGSKAARHAHREKARRRRRKPGGAGESTGHDEELLQLLAASVERLDRYKHCRTASEGAEAAQALLKKSLDELVSLTAPYDPWDLVELLRVRCTPPAPAAGQGSDPEAIAALVELVAVAVAGDGRKETTQRAIAETPLAAPVIDRLHRLALECLHRGSEAVAFQAAADAAEDALARIRVGATLREMTVRNQVYPHMLRDTLRALFGTPEVEADCREALGFTVDDAIAVLDACCELRGRVWDERMAAVASTSRLAVFLAEAAERGEIPDRDLDGPRERALVGVREAKEKASSNPADAIALDARQLAAHTGLVPDLVSAVIDVFTLKPLQQNPREAALAFLTGTSPLRMTPLLRDASGRVLLVHDALHLPAIRETFEQSLKDANRWAAYSKHRGTYLEEAAAELLRRHLPQADVHSGFEYFVPDPAAPVPQAEPARYTKRAEGDVLVVADDIAIIVEAKAVALNPRARAGDSMRLRRDLTRIVTDAAAQAQRLRERIETDHGVRLRDGRWLDLAHVREVHTVAISLEDLSGIATTTADLVRTGLLPPGNLPWTVSLHDLQVISELIARPAELVLYLRRRTDTETTQKFQAVDELDLFLHFYEGGLYVEPDPDRIAREFPQFGPPTVAARRRRNAETATLLTSCTDRLDAWYFYQLGHTRTPVEKPAMKADAGVLALIDEITTLARPGWLAVATTLLDGSAATQRQFASAADLIRKQSTADGLPHSVTLIGGTSQLDTHVLIWTSVPHPAQRAQIHEFLLGYLRAKKHQMQTARAAGFLIDARSGKVIDFLFDNRPPGPDPELDQLAAEMGLQPTSSMPHSLPPPKARRPRR